MARVAEHIRPTFPHYASALREELGKRMTGDRWHTINAILSSLNTIPGAPLKEREHDVRNPALNAATLAQEMAITDFRRFTKDVSGDIGFIVRESQRIGDWIESLRAEKEEKADGGIEAR